MIFQLACTVAALAAASSEEMEDLFSRLLDADRVGRHFFVAERQLCDWAYQNLDLSGRDRGHLMTVREQYASRQGLVTGALARVNVLIGNRAVSLAAKGRFEIGHRALLGGEYLLRKVSLVVEDIDSDAALYRTIFSEIASCNRMPPFGFEPVHGGGGGIGRVFDSEVGKAIIVVCLVDNDKLALMDRKSSSAREVLRNYTRRNLEAGREEECFIGLAATTVGRELENYIPLSALRQIPQYRLYPHYQLIERILRRDEMTEPSNAFWLYFDVKSGLTGTRVLEKHQNGCISQEVVSWICDKVGCSREGLEHLHIGRFEGRVVNVFLECNEALAEFHRVVRGERWREAFGGYFEEVLWFLVAPPSERT